MTNGYIHSLESMGLVDGPGIRSVVFMQGCPLRCQYCHNPDTWDTKGGKEMSAEDLIRQLTRFKAYYGSDGGVTFSGGEPLMQPDFLAECLYECKKVGINTCIDTSGCGLGDYGEILKNTDLILYDIKHYTKDGYRLITGGDISVTLKFLDEAQKNCVPLWIRHVVVPNLTDGDEHFIGLESYIKTLKNVRRVELLPYHTLGVSKYAAMGIKYKLEGTMAMPPENVKKWNDRLNQTCCSI